MNKKLELIKQLYSDLSYDERSQIREFINDFEKKSYDEKTEIKKSIKESFNKYLGPTMSNSCPLCGK